MLNDFIARHSSCFHGPNQCLFPFLNCLMTPSNLVFVVAAKSIFESFTDRAAAYRCLHLLHACTFASTNQLGGTLDTIRTRWCCCGSLDIIPNGFWLIWFVLVPPVSTSQNINNFTVVIIQFSSIMEVIHSCTSLWANSKVNDGLVFVGIINSATIFGMQSFSKHSFML